MDKSNFKFDYFRGSGKGGQKRNKTSNCVRCTHTTSGAVGKSENGRSQLHNKQTAFKRMFETKIFQNWIRIEAYKKMGLEQEIKEKVERSMNLENIKIETIRDGKWDREIL